MAKKELTLIVRAKNALARGLAAAGNSLKSFGQTAMRVGKMFVSAFTAAGAALGAFSVKAITAWAKQEKAVNALRTALDTNGDNVDALIPKYTALAQAIQDETGAADENTIQLMAQIRNLGVLPQNMEKATKGALGLAKALNLNSESAARYTALALQGETTILQRYVPALRTAETAAEKQAIITDLMAKGYSQLQGELGTTSGRWKEFKGRVGDAWEEMGRAITEALGLNDALARASA